MSGPGDRAVCTVLAIDGPAASGKSTVSRRVAKRYGFLYVDSGALYRGVTWAALARGIPGSDTAGVLATLQAVRVTFRVEDGAVIFAIDDVTPVAELRTEAVNRNVSPVAATPEVRERVTGWLREMTQFGSLVMEGRDIGTAVFPDTPYKFYLDADPDVRAQRRHQEMAELAISAAEVGESLKRRDTIDSGRKTAPLRVAADAAVIDSSRLGIDEVVAAIVAEYERRCGR